jgi:putative N6-adenine-specific DNA methylase
VLQRSVQRERNMTRRRRRPGRARAATARFFATAAKGTEQLLADELRELGLPGVAADPGGVHFGAAVEDAWRACLWSRIALRVVEPLCSFPCETGDELYEGVRSIDWAPFFAGGRTLAIRAAGQTPELNNTQFVAIRAKDAIVDQLREQHGTRPDVDRNDPDVLVFVHLSRAHASVNIDHSGGSLHARGLRAAGAVAPLRETLAAALVRFSGWQGDTPLCDPMCGSGTLLLEAAGWAGRRAPGLERHFGFERWGTFDGAAAQRLARLREEARAAARAVPQLFASDTDPAALEQTLTQAARAGFAIQARRLALREVTPEAAPGSVLMNPPYGERLERSRDLERDLTGLLERFHEHRRALIVPVSFPVWHGTSRWLRVFNGALECEFRRYDPVRRSSTPPD